MSQATSFLLADISTYMGLVPSLIALFRLRSSVRAHRLLAILVFGSTLISLAAIWVMRTFNMPNLFLLHIYTVFNFIISTLIFKPVLNKTLANILLFSFSIFATLYSIFAEKLLTFNVLNRSISAFIIMFYALSFFARTLREMKIQRLESIPLFWISIGALFYNAGSFFIFLFSKDISPIEELWLTYFGVHSIFTILLYIFYSIALWVQPKR